MITRTSSRSGMSKETMALHARRAGSDPSTAKSTFMTEPTFETSVILRTATDSSMSR